MIITIDGPAGSGKSTAARKLAARLEIPYLDTGAMYRAIAWKGIQDNLDFSNPDLLTRMAENLDLQLDCGPTHTRVQVNGHDISEAIRTMEVSQHTSPVARTQAIRNLLVHKQRDIGRDIGSLVTEGRDQGSVVFPNADVKFVLEASAEKRARRRVLELEADGEEVDFNEVLANIQERDATDSIQWASLYQPGAAIIIDTTSMTIAEVIDELTQRVRRKASSGNGNSQQAQTA